MLPVCPARTIVILCPLLYIELFEIYKNIPLFYCICTISTAYSTISELLLWFFFCFKIPGSHAFIPERGNTCLSCYQPLTTYQYPVRGLVDVWAALIWWEELDTGEQPIVLEKIGEGGAGMAQRAPSCPGKHGLGEDTQDAGREGGGLRHLLTWQVGPGLCLVQGHYLLILLTPGFPIVATTAGSIYKMVLHSPSNVFYIILTAVDLVYTYVPVFFQRFLKWLLNTYML